jgi:hypothetical protein
MLKIRANRASERVQITNNGLANDYGTETIQVMVRI